MQLLTSITLLTIGVFSVLSAAVVAEEQSVEEIAAELANPNTVLGSMNFNLDYITYTGNLPGASDQRALSLTFQPVLPYPIEKGFNFY